MNLRKFRKNSCWNDLFVSVIVYLKCKIIFCSLNIATKNEELCHLTGAGNCQKTEHKIILKAEKYEELGVPRTFHVTQIYGKIS